MNPFFPEEEYPDTYVIPYEKLYEMGIRGIIFDIDNTLVPPDAPADTRSRELAAHKALFRRAEHRLVGCHPDTDTVGNRSVDFGGLQHRYECGFGDDKHRYERGFGDDKRRYKYGLWDDKH